ncbi:hypothetical protein JJB07_06850 [Tumebacillus sp. ITR2]|uniref:Intracellular septation protein A n=1 Tax=Tumebacillus amylolyticus TaxID=2801339 RepID=A0ABS1J803_9BACL|nr:VC0807 family protein [Tumebacillus amylolyticus]MBL0386362.1 hypothetical protein [Tumebacillus amylolyticus]
MSKQEIIRGILITLFFNFVVPLGVYELLQDHMSGVTALAIATTIPLVENIWLFVRHRQVDAFGSFMLFGFLVAIGAALISGDEKLLLARESFVSVALGLLCLGSIVIGRPLIFAFSKRFAVGNDPVARRDYDRNWQYAYFRKTMYRMTLVWGIVCLVEAVVRTSFVYAMSVEGFLAVSPFITAIFFGGAAVWNVAAARRMRSEMGKIKARRQLV